MPKSQGTFSKSLLWPGRSLFSGVRSLFGLKNSLFCCAGNFPGKPLKYP